MGRGMQAGEEEGVLGVEGEQCAQGGRGMQGLRIEMLIPVGAPAEIGMLREVLPEVMCSQCRTVSLLERGDGYPQQRRLRVPVQDAYGLAAFSQALMQLCNLIEPKLLLFFESTVAHTVQGVVR